MKEEKGYKVDKKVMIDFIKKSVEEVEGVFSIKALYAGTVPSLWLEGIQY